MKQLVRGLVLSLVAIVVGATISGAEQVVKPYNFSNGTPADATQVNANFDVLYSQMNTNSNDIANISAPKLSVRYVEKSSDYNTDGSYVSELITVSCGTNEVLTGAACGCVTGNSDLDISNVGNLLSCMMDGNSVMGGCVADSFIASQYKFGPSISVTAACTSIGKTGLAKESISKTGAPNAEAPERFKELSKQFANYARIIEEKVNSQPVQP